MKNKFIVLFLIMCYLGVAQVSWGITDFEQLDIQMNQIPLNSKLKKDFSGYEFIITNNFKEPINVVSAQIRNGQDVLLIIKKNKQWWLQ